MITGLSKKRIITYTGLICLVAGAVFYYLADPETSRWMPKCVFRSITGFDCPGCGSQRLLHDLLHGDVVSAWHHNALLLCSIPMILIYIVLEFLPDRWPKLYRVMYSPVMIYSIGGAILIWWLIRNLLNV